MSARKHRRRKSYDIEDQLAAPEETITDTQAENGKLFQSVLREFQDYCAHSSIHGVRYFGEKKRHWVERCWWIIGFVISLSCCGGLIYKMYSKWDETSVIVSFAEDLIPVWQIPFPAITICPTTKVNITQMNITDGFEKIMEQMRPPSDFSDEDLVFLKAVSQICEPYIGEFFGTLGLGDKIADSSIVELLKETAPQLHDTIYDCIFPNNEQNLCQFEEIMTEEGLCFTFNTLSETDSFTNDISPDYSQIRHNRTASWNLETGYNSNIDMDSMTYPYRVTGSGADGDRLRAWLELSAKNLEYKCRGPIQGYTIALHLPGEIPQISKYYYIVPLLQEVSVSVKANIIRTSDGLRHYHHERRRCFFDSERKLRFLKVYTQRNCELECLSNATLNECGCVKFFLPRDAATPICGSENIRCYHSVRDKMMKFNIAVAGGIKRPCNCLPACNSIVYDAEISQNAFDWNSYARSLKVPKNDSAEYLPTRFQIFFKENEFITLTRTELYGPIDFVASCGGLLGLCTGASLLSVFELLYFCSLRLCCTRVIRRREADSAFNEDSKKGRIANVKQTNTNMVYDTLMMMRVRVNKCSTSDLF